MAIANAVERSGFVYVYDEKGYQLCMLPAGEGLTGYTFSTVNIKRSDFIYSYNEKGQQISFVPSR
jgi:hypothetical protein